MSCTHRGSFDQQILNKKGVIQEVVFESLGKTGFLLGWTFLDNELPRTLVVCENMLKPWGTIKHDDATDQEFRGGNVSVILVLEFILMRGSQAQAVEKESAEDWKSLHKHSIFFFDSCCGKIASHTSFERGVALRSPKGIRRWQCSVWAVKVVLSWSSGLWNLEITEKAIDETIGIGFREFFSAFGLEGGDRIQFIRRSVVFQLSFIDERHGYSNFTVFDVNRSVRKSSAYEILLGTNSGSIPLISK
ncbi:hypothetical protein Tco_0553251 [Tanacetum coccineum]|uniref:Uncharacterized protein n=1 Tax=Tanacetum coccineum TaxID=301880 RepID=A0ABQ5AS12_9ASTR